MNIILILSQVPKVHKNNKILENLKKTYILHLNILDKAWNKLNNLKSRSKSSNCQINNNQAKTKNYQIHRKRIYYKFLLFRHLKGKKSNLMFSNLI